jgi:hypothetical protein
MNVMKRAWEIAKEGQTKFGGKVKEYFAEALKMAWSEVKLENNLDIENEKFDFKYNEWKNYGKHRAYIDTNIDLVEYKNVNGERVGVRRRLIANYYYDVKTNKMYVREYVEKDLRTANEKVAQYMKKKVKDKAFEIAKKFKAVAS